MQFSICLMITMITTLPWFPQWRGNPPLSYMSVAVRETRCVSVTEAQYMVLAELLLAAGAEVNDECMGSSPLYLGIEIGFV